MMPSRIQSLMQAAYGADILGAILSGFKPGKSAHLFIRRYRPGAGMPAARWLRGVRDGRPERPVNGLQI